MYNVGHFGTQSRNAGESHMINKHGNFRFFLPLGFVLALAGILFAQSTPTKNKILVVNGKNAGPVVRQIDGRSYVDIETLAQVTNGAVTIERHRIVVTIPASDSRSTASAAPASAAPPNAAPPNAGPDDAGAAERVERRKRPTPDVEFRQICARRRVPGR